MRFSFVRAATVGLLTLAFLPLAGCSKFDALNALVPSGGYARTADLPYGGVPRQKLDVYVPRRPCAATTQPAKPVVIFFYGGSWQSGEKGDYRFAAEALTSRGFVAVLPDYRLWPEATFPAFVEDGAKAVRWVRQNIDRFGGDSSRIYLMGHSAGAHIVALLTLDKHYLQNVGLDRRTIRAAAALSGPYDFVPRPGDRPPLGMTAGDEHPDPKIEPITFADGTAPPLLLIYGLQDTTVDPGNAYRLMSKIRAAGGDVRYLAYPDLAHVGVVLSLAWPFRWLGPVLDDSTAFFRAHGAGTP